MKRFQNLAIVATIDRLTDAITIAKDCGDQARIALLQEQLENAEFELMEWQEMLEESEYIEEDSDSFDDDDLQYGAFWMPAKRRDIVDAIIPQIRHWATEKARQDTAKRIENGNQPEARNVDEVSTYDGADDEQTAIHYLNDRLSDSRFEARTTIKGIEFRRIYSSKRKPVCAWADGFDIAGGLLADIKLPSNPTKSKFCEIVPAKYRGLSTNIDARIASIDNAKYLNQSMILGAYYALLPSDEPQYSGHSCHFTGWPAYYPPSEGGVFLSSKAGVQSLKRTLRQDGADLKNFEAYQEAIENCLETRLSKWLHNRDLAPAVKLAILDTIERIQAD